MSAYTKELSFKWILSAHILKKISLKKKRKSFMFCMSYAYTESPPVFQPMPQCCCCFTRVLTRRSLHDCPFLLFKDVHFQGHKSSNFDLSILFFYFFLQRGEHCLCSARTHLLRIICCT